MGTLMMLDALRITIPMSNMKDYESKISELTSQATTVTKSTHPLSRSHL